MPPIEPDFRSPFRQTQPSGRPDVEVLTWQRGYATTAAGAIALQADSMDCNNAGVTWTTIARTRYVPSLGFWRLLPQDNPTIRIGRRGFFYNPLRPRSAVGYILPITFQYFPAGPPGFRGTARTAAGYWGRITRRRIVNPNVSVGGFVIEDLPRPLWRRLMDYRYDIYDGASQAPAPQNEAEMADWEFAPSPRYNDLYSQIATHTCWSDGPSVMWLYGYSSPTSIDGIPGTEGGVEDETIITTGHTKTTYIDIDIDIVPDSLDVFRCYFGQTRGTIGQTCRKFFRPTSLLYQKIWADDGSGLSLSRTLYPVFWYATGAGALGNAFEVRHLPSERAFLWTADPARSGLYNIGLFDFNSQIYPHTGSTTANAGGFATTNRVPPFGDADPGFILSGKRALTENQIEYSHDARHLDMSLTHYPNSGPNYIGHQSEVSRIGEFPFPAADEQAYRAIQGSRPHATLQRRWMPTLIGKGTSPGENGVVKNWQTLPATIPNGAAPGGREETGLPTMRLCTSFVTYDPFKFTYFSFAGIGGKMRPVVGEIVESPQHFSPNPYHPVDNVSL